jgi:hypothetical protein
MEPAYLQRMNPTLLLRIGFIAVCSSMISGCASYRRIG